MDRALRAKRHLTAIALVALAFGFSPALLAAPRRSGPRKKPVRAVVPVVEVEPRATAPEPDLEIEDRLRVGRDAMATQRFSEAEFAFSSVLKLNPRNAEALAGAAEAAFENAHYDQALAWAERAVWEAATVKNLTLLGHADSKMGLFEKAKVAYAQALAQRPDDPDLKEYLRRTEAELALPITDRTRANER